MFGNSKEKMLKQKTHAKLEAKRRAEIAKERGEITKRSAALGTTGIATQPISYKVDHEVYQRLHDGHAPLLNDSARDPKLRPRIQSLITSGDDFRGLPTYGRPVIAHEVMIDVSGLGILERLFKLHPGITDMGFNGRHLTYKTNDHKYVYGQQPGENDKLLQGTEGHERIALWIHKFTYNEQNDSPLDASHPIFNGQYNFGGPADPSLRVSVTDKTLTPLGNYATFSLRKSLPHLALKKSNFKYNSPMFVYSLLNVLMKSNANILISGITGSGKTELQKMLIGFIQPADKIIMIEDTPETHLDQIYPDKDILMWETSPQADLSTQVANSLRNDADWCMVSETRGAEAYQMFQSVKTGHHITTTLHASSNDAVPSRFAGMCEEAKNIDVPEDILRNDFVAFMNIGIHTDSKVIGGHTFRYIDNISEFVPYSYDKSGTHTLFEQRLEDKQGTCVRHWRTFAPTNWLKNMIRDALDPKEPFKMPHQEDKFDHTMIVPKPKPGE